MMVCGGCRRSAVCLDGARCCWHARNAKRPGILYRFGFSVLPIRVPLSAEGRSFTRVAGQYNACPSARITAYSWTYQNWLGHP